MKKLLLVSAIAIVLLSSCGENRCYVVKNILDQDEVVVSDEALVSGDTVRIGYDLGGREVASKDMGGDYIGHIAIVK